MIDNKNQIELKTGKHWVSEDQIFHSKFIIPAGCPMIDSRMIKEHLEVIHHFLGNRELPFLIDLTTSESVLSFDALKKWGQSELLNDHRLVEAYVVNNLADLIFMKQHIRLNKIQYPAMVFQGRKLAIEWLKSYTINHNPSRSSHKQMKMTTN